MKKTLGKTSEGLLPLFNALLICQKEGKKSLDTRMLVLMKPPDVLPLSLLSSTRMISLSRCAGVWLTTLWTERRITDRASFTKMKTTEI